MTTNLTHILGYHLTVEDAIVVGTIMVLAFCILLYPAFEGLAKYLDSLLRKRAEKVQYKQKKEKRRKEAVERDRIYVRELQLKKERRLLAQTLPFDSLTLQEQKERQAEYLGHALVVQKHFGDTLTNRHWDKDSALYKARQTTIDNIELSRAFCKEHSDELLEVLGPDLLAAVKVQTETNKKLIADHGNILSYEIMRNLDILHTEGAEVRKKMHWLIPPQELTGFVIPPKPIEQADTVSQTITRTVTRTLEDGTVETIETITVTNPDGTTSTTTVSSP